MYLLVPLIGLALPMARCQGAWVFLYRQQAGFSRGRYVPSEPDKLAHLPPPRARAGPQGYVPDVKVDRH
jgi:hypothetical protein